MSPDRSSISYVPFFGWQPALPAVVGRAPVAVRGWLAEPGSMTRRVEAHFGAPVTVSVLSEGRRRSGLGVAGAEGLVSSAWSGPVWVRDVALAVGGRAVIAARTVTPVSGRGGVGRLMRTLGTRPLGHILFEMPGVEAGWTDVCRLGANAPLLRRFRRQGLAADRATWARRSLHWIDGHPLVVMELFISDAFGAAPQAPR